MCFDPFDKHMLQDFLWRELSQPSQSEQLWFTRLLFVVESDQEFCLQTPFSSQDWSRSDQEDDAQCVDDNEVTVIHVQMRVETLQSPARVVCGDRSVVGFLGFWSTGLLIGRYLLGFYCFGPPFQRERGHLDIPFAVHQNPNSEWLAVIQ